LNSSQAIAWVTYHMCMKTQEIKSSVLSKQCAFLLLIKAGLSHVNEVNWLFLYKKPYMKGVMT